MSVDHSEIKFEGDTCNYPDTPKPQIVIELMLRSHIRQVFQLCYSNDFVTGESRCK